MNEFRASLTQKKKTEFIVSPFRPHAANSHMHSYTVTQIFHLVIDFSDDLFFLSRPFDACHACIDVCVCHVFRIMND